MLNSCSSMHVKSQSCIVLFDLLLQQLYGILGQPSYIRFCRENNHILTIIAQEKDVNKCVIAKKSKHKQPDQKHCQYNRVNIWLEKGLPDSVDGMYITFACLVGLIEYNVKKAKKC